MIICRSQQFTIRSYQAGDEVSLQKHIHNRSIFRNTTNIPYPYTLRDARQWIRDSQKLLNQRPLRHAAFCIEVAGEVVGGIGFHSIEGFKAELGYWLGEPYWGKGIMTQAVRVVTRYGFRVLKLRRIYATVFTHNTRSMRVLEKVGFLKEGVMRKAAQKGNRYIDLHLFSVVR